MGVFAGFHCSNVDSHRLLVPHATRSHRVRRDNAAPTPDDSAAHIAEETAGAARAAPIAILVSVAATASFGWLLEIAASFATTSVDDLLNTDLPLPMGQLFLNVLGQKGMLALWSFVIITQVRSLRACHIL